MKKKKTKKLPNRSTQERRTWTWFSRYIRLRDANDQGVCYCISCDTPSHYKNCHAGHYVPRSYHALKYDEINVNAQCARCNTYLSGNLITYRMALVDKYGENEIKRLDAIYKAKAPYKIQMSELRDMEVKYEQLAKEMAQTKGLTI